MARFRYEGFTKSGDVKRGYIDADKIENAAEELRAMGIFSQKLEPDGPQAMKSVLPGGTPLDPEPVVSRPLGDSSTLEAAMAVSEILKRHNLVADIHPPGPSFACSPVAGLSAAMAAEKAEKLVAEINAAENKIQKKAKAEPADWQKELKDNLAIIGKVSKYCEKNEKLFADIPNPEFGKQLAVTEAVKQALMKAIYDAR